MTLDDIESEIRNQFQAGPPNGLLLGWDEVRCSKAISAAVAPHKVLNHTSFDYGFCNWFEVRVDGERPPRHWKLTIKISFIAPAYCIYWTPHRATHAIVRPIEPRGRHEIEQKARLALENAGFFELPSEWEEAVLDGVELELSGCRNVTIGKCLFSDYES